jgi:hypothetical protein
VAILMFHTTWLWHHVKYDFFQCFDIHPFDFVLWTLLSVLLVWNFRNFVILFKFMVKSWLKNADSNASLANKSIVIYLPSYEWSNFNNIYEIKQELYKWLKAEVDMVPIYIPDRQVPGTGWRIAHKSTGSRCETNRYRLKKKRW